MNLAELPLGPLERALVDSLQRLDPAAEPLVLVSAALLCMALDKGDVCLPLARLAGQRPWLEHSFKLPGLADWRQQLQASPLVGGADSFAPMILDRERLYLARYQAYEQHLAERLLLRAADLPRVDEAQLSESLTRLFTFNAQQPDWQRLAAAQAVRRKLAVISGGPGTGKTTTVVRLLALLQAPAVESGSPLRIRLAAPTGKAAARLTESISQQVLSLTVPDDVREKIPTQVTTVHRLLGSRPGTRHFRHHLGNPLPLDVLVVDEASMIDLEMMANLLDALAPHARLVLLGDKDQLASVEAGAVLGDLCRDAEAGWYSPQTRQWLQAVSGEDLSASGLQEDLDARHPLAQQVVMLRYSRRFGEGSGIGQLARWVNQQNAEEARQLLAARRHDDLFCLSLKGEHDHALERLVLDGQGDGAQGYRYYLNLLQSARPPLDTPRDDPAWTYWAQQLLQAFDAFQLLCAVRKGPWGVEGLNQRITAALRKVRLIEGDEQWYEGRPVLMTRNDYGLGLMNGDIGIALKLPESDGGPHVLRVAFPRNDGQGGVRFVLPSRLNDVETVYAMTVHKSQGSEFIHTALILPDALNPVLTKELIYTGITRAKRWFSLIEPRGGVFEEAVRRKVKRLSGLMLELDAAPEKTD